MPTIRHATPSDATLITDHRHRMFDDNHLASGQRLVDLDTNFLPWVTEHLADGRYVGLLLSEDDQPDHVLASAGIFFHDFPPHWLDLEPQRAYLLNFYTAPEARGRGYANLLLNAAVEVAKNRGIGVITLHASPFGRPIYEKFGFAASTEMMLLPGS